MNSLTWDQYFMALAKVTAMRSKDPSTQVGCAIVNEAHRVVALGYNGMPHGDDSFPWTREAELAKDTKYPYVIHAEVNAVLNANAKISGTSLYVTLFPCSSCAKLVAQAGVSEIVYVEDKYGETEDGKIAHAILKQLKVKTRKISDIKFEVK